MAQRPVIYDDSTKEIKHLSTQVFQTAPVVDQSPLITINAQSVTVTFAVAFTGGTTTIVVPTWFNGTDTNPQFQPFTVTAADLTGFTVKWNAPLDSGNFRFNYVAKRV